MNKIALLRDLISKTEDAEERKKYEDQLIEAIEEAALAKATKQLADKAAKDKEEAEIKAAKGKSVMAKRVGAPPVVVLEQGDYKGFNLRSEVRAAIGNNRVHVSIQTRMQDDYDMAEKMMRMFTDLYVRAWENPVQKAAMQEGTDSEGGYLTPTEERSELLAYVREISIALQDCTHIPMASDSMTLPRELANVSVAYTGEESEATESEPTFNQVTLTAKRMDAYAISSNELIQDTTVPGGIIGVLMSQFVEAIGQKVDSTVFKGTGDPVSGVFLSAGYSQVFESGSTHFSELLELDLRTIISKIPTSRLANAKWYGHRSPVWIYVRGLKDGDSRPLFIKGLTEKAPDFLYGYPLKMPEQSNSISAVSTGMLVFGDLRGFFIGDRLTNINLMVNPYLLMTTNQTLFYMATRWGYAHALPNYYGRIATPAS